MTCENSWVVKVLKITSSILIKILPVLSATRQSKVSEACRHIS